MKHIAFSATAALAVLVVSADIADKTLVAWVRASSGTVLLEAV